MAVITKISSPEVFDVKSVQISLVAFLLETADVAQISHELQTRYGEMPDFFNHDPVVLDISQLRDSSTPIDFAALTVLLRSYKMCPVGVRGASPEQLQQAVTVGLCDASETASSPARPEGSPKVILQDVVKEVVREVVREVPVNTPTMVIDKPLRSGQRVYAKGGDLIVLSAVNFGAEVIADGNIHVYAPLRGKAIAGAQGQSDARIFSTCMEPELVSIAGTYRTTEHPLPPEVLGKAALIRLEGHRMVFEAIA